VGTEGVKQNSQPRIPVLDLFAGPGGLAEGFSAFHQAGKNSFKICLSIEKDRYAHSTLELRSFFRQFPRGHAPDEYYAYLRKEITRDELFNRYSSEAEAAKNEAWCAELGSLAFSAEEVDIRIEKALGGSKNWVLIGGPPCQAYSTVGRSRNKGIEGYVPEEDPRHFLYREYLRIISRHWPSVFVMENVKGLLSAKVNGSNIFDHILEDLHDPNNAIEKSEGSSLGRSHKYKIYSLAEPLVFPPANDQPAFRSSDYLLMSENYGIPQARHRVILLGVRDDLGDVLPGTLMRVPTPVTAASVLDDLPKLRSGLSREADNDQAWQEKVWEILESVIFKSVVEVSKEVQEEVEVGLTHLHLTEEYGRGSEFIRCHAKCNYRPALHPEWYLDERLGGICNSCTKTHMGSDLHRYLFAASFAKIYNRSPSLPEFPVPLLPDHKNTHKTKRSGNFADRFRVQLEARPSTTIMSHIAKDGHYYIHYDPAQCRSLTVREAARLQTFPDNYFFEGNKTQQYTQVGNAVPPLLAVQIAEIVYNLLRDNKWID
jgi:DNA (cytosine-5)-methyltransferase 1